MRVLVIDNFDSFTYNLVQYLLELGAEVVVRRSDAPFRELERTRPRAVVVSPGPCTPREAGVSVEAIRRWAGKKPILGVCLGHQCIGAAFGGRIVRAPTLMHGKTSEIRHDGRTVFAGLPNPFPATRYHSLMIERRSLPKDLEVTAWTSREEAGKERGRGGQKKRRRSGAGAEVAVIMGVRHRTLPVEGVQFHPESILTPEGMRLLGNFLGRARG